jgi:hypothetical protein
LTPARSILLTDVTKHGFPVVTMKQKITYRLGRPYLSDKFLILKVYSKLILNIFEQKVVHNANKIENFLLVLLRFQHFYSQSY